MNKINNRRLADLEKFDDPDIETLQKIDNSVYDFLNRESKGKVVNAAVD